MGKKNSGTLLLVFGLLIAPAAYGTPSKIVNGSFETAFVDPGGTWTALWSGSTAIAGWTVFGENIHYLGVFWQASDGSRSLDLDGIAGYNGGIMQTFSTTPGVEYVVNFDMAGNLGNAPTIKPMRVSADGQSQDFTFDVTGWTFDNMGWTPHTWSFIADDTSATLAFASLTTFKGWGPALDNVRVTEASPTVPAPGAILLGTIGAGLISWLRRRRTL